MTGFYQTKEVNGWLACCYYDVTSAGNVFYVQRFVTGASNQRINVGKQYILKQLPENWERIA